MRIPDGERRSAPGLVSVVVPARNAADTIGAQLEALGRQTYGGCWEVVVVDNGSSDGTAQQCARWRSSLPSLRIVRADDRAGVAYARNCGARAAAGDLVAMCDADDRVTPTWLESLVRAAVDADLVGGRLDDTSLNGDRRAPAGAVHPGATLPTALGFLPYAVTSNVAVWSDVLTSIGGWREDYLDGAEDIEFSWRAQMRSYRLAFAPDAVVHYRYRASARAGARQAHRWGISHAQLLADYRALGARPRPLPEVARTWARLGVRTPLLVRRSRRARWMRSVAFNLGLVRGSLRHRVVCL